jgi:hypothetical protein
VSDGMTGDGDREIGWDSVSMIGVWKASRYTSVSKLICWVVNGLTATRYAEAKMIDVPNRDKNGGNVWNTTNSRTSAKMT